MSKNYEIAVLIPRGSERYKKKLRTFIQTVYSKFIEPNRGSKGLYYKGRKSKLEGEVRFVS